MRHLAALLTFVAVIAAFPPHATAGDVEDIKAQMQDVLVAWSNGDVEAIASTVDPHRTEFGIKGVLSEKYNKQAIQAWFDNGLKVNLTWRHLDVKVYGKTAVLTGYLSGIIVHAQPVGGVDDTTLRYSSVHVKKNGQWKTVHVHISPL
ncbi:MAG: nuclear transport factor 2 family protein [Candidatus Glassbacteria bacterium]|nr:nuclear transport factor 2 family protein [Candidatus Glassbacteria bacterium]